MIKRVNSTGRRRIPRDRITLEVHDGTPRTFSATIDLTGFDAPPNAEVMLEATCAGSSEVVSIRCGTVARPVPPVRCELSQLRGEHVFFTLKVIDRSERFGRILGRADGLRPVGGGSPEPAGRRGILPVDTADLGDELWRLEFKTEEVFLLVNAKVPGLAERLRFDPAVFALIYPAILREVLGRALDEQADTDGEEERWSARWLRFARGVHDAPPPADDEEERREWIAEVVAGFCRDQQLREKFAGRAGGEGRS